jgi:hypothetical protein
MGNGLTVASARRAVRACASAAITILQELFPGWRLRRQWRGLAGAGRHDNELRHRCSKRRHRRFATNCIYFDRNPIPGLPDSGFLGNHAPRIPDNVEVVAAYLYWETIEKTDIPSSTNGIFDGQSIVAKTLGAGHAAPCWSGGGTTGSSQGAPTLRVYRADVLRYLPVLNGLRVVNGAHTVSLPDSGSNGGGVPLTEGASLVVVYRYLFPDSISATKNLHSIVIFDGAATTSNTYPSYTQQITGFYQASGTPGTPGRMTHIVGDGQSNFKEQLTITSQSGTSLIPKFVSSTNPFLGAQGLSWDNLTFDLVDANGNSLISANDASLTTTVGPAPGGGSSDCLSWGAIVTSTEVVDTDRDGLLDNWEQYGLYEKITKDTSGNVTEALFGTCADFPDDTANCVDLPRMGAKKGTRDIFIEIDWMETGSHSHKPKQEALTKIAAAFALHSINVHFDVGKTYQDLATDATNYEITPWQYTQGTKTIVIGQGGEVIDEDSVKCSETDTLKCAFPTLSGIVGWKTGLEAIKDGNPKTTPPISPHFQHNRKDIFRYALFGHALGLPTAFWDISGGSLASIIVADNVATVTVLTTLPAGFSGGAHVLINGASGALALNAGYSVLDASGKTFTVKTLNVPNGTYLNRGLSVTYSSGKPTSVSGIADKGDIAVTLGQWRSDNSDDDQVGSVIQQAGTLMHELGHALGRAHAGDVRIPNCAPDYASVMNYHYQTRGLTDKDGNLQVDYSSGGLVIAPEYSLKENAPFGSPLRYRVRYFGPQSFLDAKLGNRAKAHCDGSPTNGALMVRLESAGFAGVNNPNVDWNNDLIYVPANGSTVPAQDVNFNGSIGASNDTDNKDSNHDSKDWDNLDLRRTGARASVTGLSVDVGGLDIGGLDVGGLYIGGLDIGGLDIGGLDIGGLDIGGLDIGGLDIGEIDFDTVSSSVDPATSLGGKVISKPLSINLNWLPPGFGRIRGFDVYRAVGDISSVNSGTKICTASGPLACPSWAGPPAPVPATFTTFTDTTVKANTIYSYYVTAKDNSNPQNSSGSSANWVKCDTKTGMCTPIQPVK